MDEAQKKRAKYERTTQHQLDFFVRFCQTHPVLQTGKNCPQSPHAVQDIWQECADNLNSMRGPTRTAAKWKETLAVWKSQLRSRARKRKAKLRMTGGGVSTTAVLSDFEELALQTFGAAAVDGIAEVGALGLRSNASDLENLDPQSPIRPALQELNEVVLPQNSLLCTSEPPSTSRCPRQQISPRQKKISLEDMYTKAKADIERREERDEQILKLIKENIEATNRLTEAINVLNNKLA